ncbi:hypothetical protein E2C01_074653 [Portunus trituberculatus]|uniref:Uncharacterized protein n=1 Tax=Portunus trituberculatus TaxID=210409 RepID=A0A5B7IDP9_PORTR|nr:hypothetical protein [Portunus trituberculatus]
MPANARRSAATRCDFRLTWHVEVRLAGLGGHGSCITTSHHSQARSAHTAVRASPITPHSGLLPWHAAACTTTNNAAQAPMTQPPPPPPEQ